VRIHHVSIPIPPGGQDVGRAFYRDVVGLSEIAIPRSLEPLGVVWFAVGDGETEVHLLPESPSDPAAERHFALLVDDCEPLRRRLEAAGYATWDSVLIPGRTRCFTRDPFGNAIELWSVQNASS
jgi:catechol 2,3-dioxygenase-like lactoylglutathione lyase family enzyme